METVLSFPPKDRKNGLQEVKFTLKTANSAGSAAVFVRVSGFRANPVKYTDPDGRYINITDLRIIRAFNQMYAKSETFRTVINNFAKDTNIVFQFSNMKHSTGEYGRTNPRYETTPENGVTVFMLNDEGTLEEVNLSGGTNILVVHMSIDVEKIDADAAKNGHSADLYLKTAIGHETGHGKDLQEKGFNNFWQEVTDESKIPHYNERPSEIRNDDFALKIVSEINE
jgi:hypothetical protein